MTAQRALIAPLLCAGVAALVVIPDAPTKGLREANSGYEAVVNQLLIPMSILRPTDLLEAVRRNPASLGDDPIVVLDENRLDEEDRLHPGLRAFVDASYLRFDLARNDPGLWEDDNVLTRINRGAHALVSPFIDTNWRGNLLYGGDGASESDGPSMRMFVRLARDNQNPDEGWQEIPVGGTKHFGSGFRSTGRAIGGKNAIDLQQVTDMLPDGQLLFTYWRDNQTMSLRTGTATYCNSHDRYPLLSNGREVRITPGICLHLVRPEDEGEAIEFLVLPQGRVISGDTGDARTRYWRLVRSARASMADWVQKSCAGGCAEATNDIPTTLDANLSVFVQEALDGAYKEQSLNRAAAITVMDGDGRILALASHEGAELFQSDKPIGHEDVNFRDFAIGSIAKPLITSAILAHFPDVEDLEILQVPTTRKGKEAVINSVLGTRLESPMQAPQEPGPLWLDAERFIALSSNQYAAGLAMLTSCLPQDADPINPAVKDHPGYRTRAAIHPCFATAAERSIALPWWNDFLDRYGNPGDVQISTHSAESEMDPPPPTRLPVLWEGENVPVGVARSMPSPVTFHWPKIRNLKSFRTDIVPLILGGQEYGWSNILLAQSFARLVTGKHVDATLVKRRPNPQSIDVGEASVNKRICAGLENVPRGMGTAARANLLANLQNLPGDARSRSLVLLAKTGTPKVDSVDTETLNRTNAIDRCIRDNELRLVTSASGSYQLAGRCPWLVAGGTVVQPLSGRGNEMLEVGNTKFLVSNGRLIRSVARVDYRFSTKAFVFGLGTRRLQNEPAGAGCEQISERNPMIFVAINVQDPASDQGVGAHLRIAQQLLGADSELIRWVRKKD
jgi:hypothetical protein